MLTLLILTLTQILTQLYFTKQLKNLRIQFVNVHICLICTINQSYCASDGSPNHATIGQLHLVELVWGVVRVI